MTPSPDPTADSLLRGLQLAAIRLLLAHAEPIRVEALLAIGGLCGLGLALVLWGILGGGLLLWWHWH